MTTTPTTTTAIPCPSWCTVEHGDDPPGGFHASAWVAHPPQQPQPRLWQVDTEGSRPGVVMAGHVLDHAAAHELGMDLVRMADRLRREEAAR